MNVRDLLDKAIDYYKQHKFNPLTDGNIFSILKMEHKEVSAHSAFLYFVFKPFIGSDGKIDNDNLAELMSVLNPNKKYKFLDIEREVSSEFGRMDFVVRADDEAFVIELKIWAGEQKLQLERYSNYLVSQGSNKDNIFFLTPTPRRSETYESATNITLEKDIKSVLEKIGKTRADAGFFDYSAMINQYITIINKITKGDHIMETSILQTKEDLLAVNQLVSAQKDKLNSLMQAFFYRIRDMIGTTLQSEKGPSARLIEYAYGESAMRNYYNQIKYPAIVYEVDECPIVNDCELNADIGLYFFIEIHHNLYCGISPRSSAIGVDKSITVDCKKAIVNYSNLESIARNNTQVFAIWDYIKYDGHCINFTPNGLESGDSFLSLVDDERLEFSESCLNNIVNQIKDRYNEFCKKFFVGDKIIK